MTFLSASLPFFAANSSLHVIAFMSPRLEYSFSFFCNVFTRRLNLITRDLEKKLFFERIFFLDTLARLLYKFILIQEIYSATFLVYCFIFCSALHPLS